MHTKLNLLRSLQQNICIKRSELSVGKCKKAMKKYTAEAKYLTDEDLRQFYLANHARGDDDCHKYLQNFRFCELAYLSQMFSSV